MRLYGTFKAAAKRDDLELVFDSPISVRQLVGKLVNIVAQPEFESYLIDGDTRDPRPNALILVSGTEIGALNGIDTALRDGDEVVLLPVAHGGWTDQSLRDSSRLRFC